MRYLLFLAAAVATPSIASGQDLQPWGSAMIQSGQVATMNNAIRKGARSGSAPRVSRTGRQAEACASRSRFRSQYGASHPQVRQLERLCSQAGY